MTLLPPVPLKSVLLLLLALSFFRTEAQTPEKGWVLLPEGLNFLPLRGNAQEAKMGVLYYFATSNLKVDMGNSIDILGYHKPFGGEGFISAGAEFMAYAYSTSYKGYRLQIDAIDGFFGGNVTYRIPRGKNTDYWRFRYIHNSAHLVDGAFDMSTLWWKENRLPIPYTRDFAEVIYAPVIDYSPAQVRYYGGGSYSVLRRPDELKRASFIAGAEYHHPELLGTFMNQPVNFFLILNTNITGLPKYTLSTQAQAGVKFGKWSEKGVLFYLSYFTGNDVFSEYYAQRVSRLGIGFTVDFPG